MTANRKVSAIGAACAALLEKSAAALSSPAFRKFPRITISPWDH